MKPMPVDAKDLFLMLSAGLGVLTVICSFLLGMMKLIISNELTSHERRIFTHMDNIYARKDFVEGKFEDIDQKFRERRT